MGLTPQKRNAFVQMTTEEMDQCISLKEDCKVFYVDWPTQCKQKFNNLSEAYKKQCMQLPGDKRTAYIEMKKEYLDQCIALPEDKKIFYVDWAEESR